MRSVSVGYKTRFYPDELNDFMARMQWAHKGKGNRNPKVKVNGKGGLEPVFMNAKAGQVLRLWALYSSDPDGDKLTFRWWQQLEIGKTKVVIDKADQPIAFVRVPADAHNDTVHIICEVHDNGPFHLVSYRRVCVHLY